jgi:hypothetical protein
MFQDFDPKERKAILVFIVVLLGGAFLLSGGSAVFEPEDPFQQLPSQRMERGVSPMESGSYESYF